jgi:hypothetical protein
MAFTKHAKFDAHVLGVKGSTTQRTASLDKFSDFEDYRTEDGYLYARIRAISSRVNKNHDGWPSVELAGGPDIFEQHTSSEGGFTVEASKDRHYGFSSFLGKPIFVDHHNSDPSKARGVIVDSKFHVDDHKTASLDPYYASDDVDPEHLPASWVELLLEVDAKSFPRLAKAIIEGSRNPAKGIDGFSMGCDVERSVCNICKNSATSPDEFCKHVKRKGLLHDYEDPETGKRISKTSYENCYGIKFFEISAVFDPADETALLREVRSSRTATEMDPPANATGSVACPTCVGSGIRNETGYPEECPDCYGTGCMLGGPVEGGDGAYAPTQIDPRDTHGAINTPSGLGPDIGPPRQGSTHLAENPLPQYEQPHAPSPVDTLREEKICPVCGSTMEEDECALCGHVDEPEGFDNPDLAKAKETDLRQEDQEDAPEAPGPDAVEDPGAGAKIENTPRNPGPVSHVTRDMAWEVNTGPRVAGRINTSETPVIPGNGSVSDEPNDKVLSDQNKPVTSSVRTAADFIVTAGIGRNKENNMSDTTRVAAEPIPGAENQSGQTKDHDETRVDVTGVGGVQHGTNEEASKADAQTDVLGIGGTGEESVEADKTDTVEKGNEHSKNIEAIPTKTFPNDGQHDPVTNEVFEGNGKSSGWVVQALDSGPFPTVEDANGITDGGAVQGTEPADPVGKAQERVDVTQTVTSPSNNSGKTDTWSGTDGNGVTKQQEPTTSESIAQGESGLHNSSNIFTAFKLADLEIELGLLDADRKYERAAELEQTDPSIVEASLKYAQRVKSASRKKTAATRLPVMGRNPAEKVAATEPQSTEVTADDDFLLGA